MRRRYRQRHLRVVCDSRNRYKHSYIVCASTRGSKLIFPSEIRRRYPMLSRLALIFACNFALTNVVYAQDDVDALPSSSETVQIEVLVFRFPGKGAGSELKPGQAPASNIGQAILGTSTSANDLYSEVQPSQRRLSGAMARIQASSDLKPLLFTAWRQNLSDARWVSLQPVGGAMSGSEKISGRLLLTPGKPLGLKLELQLDGAQINSVASESLNSESAAGNAMASRSFRMRASRPAHFEETLYFDHPAIGALVRVDLKAQ